MRYKLTFVAGFTAGYVLGAKAGHERYEMIMDGWHRFTDNPAVQETAGVLQAQASGAVDNAKRAVTDMLGSTVTSRLHRDRTPAGAAARGGSGSAATYPDSSEDAFGGGHT